MTNILLTTLVILVAIVAILQLVLLLRKSRVELDGVVQRLDELAKASLQIEKSVRDEIASNRQEASTAAHANREELAASLKRAADSLTLQITQFTESNGLKSDGLRNTIETRLSQIQQDNSEKVEKIRSDSAGLAQKARAEVTEALKNFNDLSLNSLKDIGSNQNTRLAQVIEQVGKLTESTDKKFDSLKESVDVRLKSIQEENAKKLDEMRATVDEKLQSTLEKRLDASFKLVSERLEHVHKGLGEMKNLAEGVGDLKKVLTNVKTRGTWGEVQLGTMLEQVLSLDQYAANVSTKNNGERVEFAIKLPGRGEHDGEVVWLPIDAKFPLEDYQRLVEAQEIGSAEAAEAAATALELRIKQCAKDICEKYINPPSTTDFAILYLPTEGLFAEVIRRIGLADVIQRQCRVVLAGPTTLWSILNSLQMGFRTLAIQERSSEVWKVLGAVKTEFGKFGSVLDGLKRKLDSAATTIDSAAQRSRAIERKLRTVEELPAAEADALLQLEAMNVAPADVAAEGK